MSTHNICFHAEKKKNISTFLTESTSSGAMSNTESEENTRMFQQRNARDTDCQN